MQLCEYITARLDEGDTSTAVEGLQNNIHTDIAHAPDLIPPDDWYAEITNRRKEGDGQTLIWLAGRPEPGYSIQE
jgi:hypothetical protein